MSYTVKAVQLSDGIRLKNLKNAFPDAHIVEDTDEFFAKLSSDRFLYVFKYGVVCFFNITTDKKEKLTNRIMPFCINQLKNDIFEFQEIVIGSKQEVDSQIITIKDFDIQVIKLIMFNVSQSVALDHYYSISEKLLDETRIHTDKLEKLGKLSISGKKLKKYIGSVLNIRNRVVENLYIFEAPDVTWENEELNALDLELKKHFDLRDRYKLVHEQIDIVKENLELFKDFMFHSESSRLEWIIIILILLEVFDLLFTKIF